MAKCSFDIVSQVDLQEVDNAVNMAIKELRNRYDFRSGKWSIEFNRKEATLQLAADSDFKLTALSDVLKNKLVQRKVSLKVLDLSDAEPAAGKSVRQSAKLRTGIEKDKAREIVKFIKDLKLKKVQAQVMDEQVRVSGNSRDDLQTIIQALKEKDTLGIAMQFTNYKG